MTSAVTDEQVQTTSGLVITPDPADGATVSGFLISAISMGNLFQNDGTSPITGGQTITLAQGAAGLKFTPSSNVPDNGGFLVQAVGAGAASPAAAATITVNPINDAPVMDNSGAPYLNAVNEDDINPAGTTVQLLLNRGAGGVTFWDPDSITSARGIAIVAVDNSHGQWQYQLPGGAWTNFPAVSLTSALLLPAGTGAASLRFLPAANYFGLVAGGITFHAWDLTSGTANTLADISTNGGSTPFSTGAETADILINEVNDAPLLQNDTWTTRQEDTGVPWYIPIATLLANDSPGPGESGTQSLTLRAASNVVGGAAVVEGANVKFTPTADFSGTASFNYAVQDNGTTQGAAQPLSATAGVSFTVTPVNDAPLLDSTGAPYVTPIVEDPASNSGTTVQTLLARGAGGTFTDADGPGRGIAVTAVNNSGGQWEYMLAGGSWTSFGVPTTANARLLDQSARVRFVPNANFNGELSSGLTYLAWDESIGASGGVADATAAGGGTAFSLNSETASMVVTPFNDLPTITNPPPSTNLAENTTAAPSSYGPYNFIVADAETPAAALTIDINSSNTSLVPLANIVLSGSGNSRSITVTPALDQSGVAVISITVTDTDQGSTQVYFTLTVNPRNTPPVAFARDVGMARNTPKQIQLAGDDGDAEFSQTLTFFKSDPSHGVLSNFNSAAGTVTYTPNPEYFGPDSFQFYVRDDASIDGVAKDSPLAAVSITIAENNHPPSLELVNSSGQPLGNPSTPEGSTLIFRAKGTDQDSADQLSYELQWRGTNGQLVPAPANVTFDVDTGLFLWAPDESQGPGVYTAVFTVSDSGTTPLKDSQTARITVTEQNLRPTISGPGWRPSVGFSDPVDPSDPPQDVSFFVSAYDNDEPAQDWTFELVSGPGSVDAATGEYTWRVAPTTPVQTFDVTFRVRDNGVPQKTHEVVVPISVIRYDQTPSQAPVANSDAWNIGHGEILQGKNILDNDTYFSSLPAIAFTPPSQGSLYIDPAGYVSYTAPSNYSGPVTFSYTITDQYEGFVLSHGTTVQIFVENTEPSVTVNPSYNVKEGDTLQVPAAAGLLLNADAGGDEIVVAAVVQPPAHADPNSPNSFTWDPNGSFNYKPAPGFTGKDSFVFKLNESAAGLVACFDDIAASFADDHDTYGIATITVGENSPPVAVDDDGFTMPGGATSFTAPAPGVLANDTDLDDAINELAAILVQGSSPEGDVALAANGGFTFTPNATFDGTATFNYYVSDGIDNSNVATATVAAATSLGIDLDVDSNNDGQIDPDNSPAGSDDPIEDDPQRPGAILALNDDDDNANGVADRQETGPFVDSNGDPMDDDDLFAANLAILNPDEQSVAGYTASLSIPAGLQVWSDRHKTANLAGVTWQAATLPSTVFVEGAATGTAMLTLHLRDPLGALLQDDTVIVNVNQFVLFANDFDDPTNRIAVTDAVIGNLYLPAVADAESVTVHIDTLFETGSAALDGEIYMNIQRSDGLVLFDDDLGASHLLDQPLPLTPSARDFALLAWLDENQNGLLDANEEKREAKVQVVLPLLEVTNMAPLRINFGQMLRVFDQLVLPQGFDVGTATLSIDSSSVRGGGVAKDGVDWIYSPHDSFGDAPYDPYHPLGGGEGDGAKGGASFRATFTAVGREFTVTVGLESGERSGYKFYHLSGDGDTNAGWVDKDTPGFGGMLLGGGGTDDISAQAWFGIHAGAGDIVVIGNKRSQDELDEAVTLLLADFAGPGNIHDIHAIDGFSFDVDDPITATLSDLAKDVAANKDGYGHEFLSKLKGAEAVYFLSGDQWPYVQLFQADRPAATIISNGNKGQRAHGSGSVVVGGTSAGLAILGQYVFTSEFARVNDLKSGEILDNYYTSDFYQVGRPSIATEVLNLKGMTDVLTETHFTDIGKSSEVDGRNIFRLGRFLSFMGAATVDAPSGLGRSLVHGLAVDEDTFLCIDNDGLAKVYGRKNVYFASVSDAYANYDSLRLTIYGNVRMNWYSPGDEFSFASAWSIDPGSANYAAYAINEGALQLVSGNWPSTFE